MNSASAIALMVIGALLILTPLVLGFEMREHIMMAHSVAQIGGHAIGSAARQARGGRLYALVCLVTGLACLITGIVRSKPRVDSLPVTHRSAA